MSGAANGAKVPKVQYKKKPVTRTPVTIEAGPVIASPPAGKRPVISGTPVKMKDWSKNG